MRKVIYTALFSNYEELKDVVVITPGWEYICYTDQPITSDVWQIRYCANVQNPVLEARRKKILEFDGDQSIWVDASFRVNCDLNDFWGKHFTSPFTVFKHPLRNCVYKEAEACIKNKRGSEKEINDAVTLCNMIGVPEENGLIQSGILLREDNEFVRYFCREWFNRTIDCSRDQITFAMTEHKLPLRVERSKQPFDYRLSDEFKFKTHFNRRK